MAADPNASQANLDNPLEIVISRTLAAPRELVWQTWSDPKHLNRWWGPAGFTTSTHAMDFRPGGSWRHTMHGPDGRDYPCQTDYVEIEEPARLVYEVVGQVDSEPVRFRTEVRFERVGDKATQVTMRSVFPNTAARDFVINNVGAVEGGKQHLANLEDHLATMLESGAYEPPFSISRVLDAPRDRVWKAWTEREHLLKWFGPKGSTMRHSTMDLRVGGTFHYCMSHPNGMELWGRWVFRSISRPDKLEFISSFSNARGEVTPAPFPGLDEFPPETLTTVTLVDHAGLGRGTLVTVEARPLGGTQAQRDFFTSFHPSMRQGWTGTMQQLAEFLAE
ncbi:MAG: SRPBCC family protein [Phycisphaerae bacterium]|nr:SRPBCC family protein [Phycisphaerae bacterium]